MLNVSKVKGTLGKWKGGKPPWMEAMSPTVWVLMPKATTRPNTVRIATSEAGIALVILGNPQIISMVRSTNPTIMYSGIPVNQLPVGSLNWSSCAIKMMMASPFTKPNITG